MVRRLAAIFALVTMLGGCTVMPVEEARRIRDAQGGRFDARGYVESLWTAKTRGELLGRAAPLEQLRRGPIDQLGKSHGTRAGEGSSWTFVTRASGVVKAVMLDQPRGAVLISGDAGEIRLQTGPVVTGTAIRDALPAINFDDFPDQIAFAEVGQRLNERAIAAVRRDLSRLRPGDPVTVVGVTNLASTDEVVVLTPLTIAPGERAQ